MAKKKSKPGESMIFKGGITLKDDGESLGVTLKNGLEESVALYFAPVRAVAKEFSRAIRIPKKQSTKKQVA